MPRGTTHIVVAACAGGVTANVRAASLKPRERALETAGGALFGGWSGTWPDVIEPAELGSHHRGPFHAVGPNAVVWSLWSMQVDGMQSWLRTRADHHSLLAANAQSLGSTLMHTLAEIVLRLLAGAVAGIPVGYLSHIALDAFTPMGVAFT